jgi:hypothetical protein
MTTNTDITTINEQTPTERSGPPRSVPLVGDEPAMREWAAELVERARHDGVELTGDDGLLTVNRPGFSGGSDYWFPTSSWSVLRAA